jgi:protein TonB
MELKKNPNADLSKRSTIYMQIGLIAILFFSWATIESRAYSKNVEIGMNEAVEILDDDWNETVKIEEPKVAIIKTKVVVQEIKAVEDDKDVEETIIENTELDEDEVIPDVVDIEVVDEPVEIIEVPFKLIENAPIFPGCENVAKAQRKKCFTKQLHKHIKKNFQYPETAQEMGIEGRVYCMFTIDEKGNITNLRFRGPDKNLEKESRRIISKLPKMTPGKQRDKNVRVPFSIPITFRLAD